MLRGPVFVSNFEPSYFEFVCNLCFVICNLFLFIVLPHRVEDVDEPAIGNGFAAMRDIGRRHHHCPGRQFLYFTLKIELELAFDDINHLFMMMGMLGQCGPRIDPPVGDGHVVGMNKLDMISTDDFSLFLLRQVYEWHVIPPF